MRLDLSHAAFRTLQRAASANLWQNIRFYRIVSGGAGASPLAVLDALIMEEDCRAAEWLAAEGITHDVIATRFAIPAPAPPQSSLSPLSPQPPSPLADEAIDHEVIAEPATPLPSQPMYAPRAATTGGIQFYLDGEPVHVGRMMPAVEQLLMAVWQRCMRLTETIDPDIRNSQRGVLRVRRDTERSFQLSAFALATEHLLLAVALDEGDVGAWLREHASLEPSTLFQRIERLHVSGAVHTSTPSVVTECTRDAIDFDDAPPLSSSPERISFAITTPQKESSAMSLASSLSVMRLLDAAANRGREAVRVLEDYARFVLNSSDFTQRLKDVRHELALALRSLPHQERMAARETQRDVGTTIEGEGEYDRCGLGDILAANAARLSESLRTLEEFLKLTDPVAARAIERLRYRCYTLEKEIANSTPREGGGSKVAGEMGMAPRDAAFLASLLIEARLYVLVDSGASAEAFSDRIVALIAAGVDLIQLRDKTASDRVLLERGEILRDAVAGQRVLCIINDRIDLALAVGADGVHLGQDELPLREAMALREHAARPLLIGISTHSFEQATTAARDGADLIGIGPVFASPTKPHLTSLVDRTTLRRTIDEVAIPAFAIGGITPANVAELHACGAERVVVSSAVPDTLDVEELTAFFASLRAASHS